MKKISLPLSEQDAAALRAGDSVLLSGTIYTARDCAHKRLFALLDEGAPLPFDLHNAVIYYAGPCPAPEGKACGSCGPQRKPRGSRRCRIPGPIEPSLSREHPLAEKPSG